MQNCPGEFPIGLFCKCLGVVNALVNYHLMVSVQECHLGYVIMEAFGNNQMLALVQLDNLLILKIK